MEQSFIINKDQRAIISRAWKQYSQSKVATSGEFILYNFLRGLPLHRGYTEKKTNIQGNNPWFAYHLACQEALRIICDVNPLEKYRGEDRWQHHVERHDVRIAAQKKKFEKKFELVFGLEFNSLDGFDRELRRVMQAATSSREAA